MSHVAVLLRAFDDAWDHPEESRQAVLDGVSDKEAYWQAPIYSNQPGMPGLPSPGTVVWHVAHLEHSARHYAYILQHRPVIDEPATPPPDEADFQQLQDILPASRATLRREIEDLRDDDLEQSCARGMSVEEFVRMSIRHEIWHAGQIVVIRRLYRDAVV